MHDQHVIWDDKDWREMERLQKAAEKTLGRTLTQREFLMWAARTAMGG